MKTQKKAQTELALPFPPKKPEELKKPVAPSSVKAEPQQVQQSESVLPYFISGFSIFLMIVLFIRMKKSEERIKTMLWRADMETLREDLARERNKVNPKIHVTGETAKVHLP